MLNDVINYDDLIDRLSTLQGWAEWDYSLEYAIAIDTVIELIEKLKTEGQSEVLQSGLHNR